MGTTTNVRGLVFIFPLSMVGATHRAVIPAKAGIQCFSWIYSSRLNTNVMTLVLPSGGPLMGGVLTFMVSPSTVT